MLELRTESDSATVSGVASLYSTWYAVGSRFQERVMPTAAQETLASSPDVVFTGEHDRSRAVARTPATLTLTEDRQGLHYRAVLDLADPDARALVSKISRGVFVESSFRFTVPRGGDSWSDDFTKRTITQLDLHRGDVSAVPFGASPTTSVSVTRSLSERRAIAEAVSSTGWAGPWIFRALSAGVATPAQDAVPVPSDDDGDEGEMVTCDECGGTGMVKTGNAYQLCDNCDGSGQVPDDGDGDEVPAQNQGRSALREDDLLFDARCLSELAKGEAVGQRADASIRADRERIERLWAANANAVLSRQLFSNYERLG